MKSKLAHSKLSVRPTHIEPTKESPKVDVESDEEANSDDDEQEALSPNEYSAESRLIGAYLASGYQRPNGMPAAEFKKFKNKAIKFVLKGNHLFRQPDKTTRVVRRVIDNDEAQQEILWELHDESGHRGREATFRRIADRYFWEGMWRVVDKYVKSCDECQKRSSRH